MTNGELDIKEWIKRAEEDIDTAKYLLKGNKLRAAGFFVQQSLEKSLKSLYIKKFGKLWKTHDLVELARIVDAPKDIIEKCAEADPAYIAMRYPGFDDDYDKDQITMIIKYAEEVLKWSKEKLQQ